MQRQNPASTTQNKVIVLLTFMDEEASYGLKDLLERNNESMESLTLSRMSSFISDSSAVAENVLGHQEESILIVSRGDIQTDLFEQNRGCYDIQDYTDRAMTTTADWENNPDSICHAVAQRMKIHLAKLDKNALIIEGAKYKMADALDENRNEVISVAQIGSGPVKYVCVQLPEMGFQSELAGQYARIILCALEEAGIFAYKNVEVQSFGAGGSVNPTLVADTLSNIEGIISTRVRVDPTVLWYSIYREIKQTLELFKRNIRKSRSALRELRDDHNRAKADGQDEYASSLDERIQKMEGAEKSYIRVDLTLQFYREHLERIKKSIDGASATYSELEIFELLGEIKKRYAEFFSEFLVVPDPEPEEKKKYYAEIALTNARSGKLIFYKTASYLERQLAEEVSRVVLLKMGNKTDEELNLSIGYLAWLESRNSEYKTLRARFNELKSDESRQTELGDTERRINEIEREEIQMLLAEAKRGTFGHGENVKPLMPLHEHERTPESPIETALNFGIARDALHREIASILSNLDSTISFAASMFIDQTMKSAMSSLSGTVVSDCNMEDDLVAQVLNGFISRKAGALVPVDSYSIKRVNVDPFDFSETIKERIQDDCRKMKFKTADYVDAVMWGLEGFQLSKLPDSANWEIATQLLAEDAAANSKLFCQINNNGKTFVINPFWREVSTDFLTSLATPLEKSKAFTPDLIANHRASIEQIIQLAQEVKEFARLNHGNSVAIRDRVTTLVKAYVGLVCHHNAETDENDVWVRKISWGGNTAILLHQLTLSGASVDRAFYVSGNFMSLNKYAREAAEMETRPVSTDPLAIARLRGEGDHSVFTTNQEPYMPAPSESSASSDGNYSMGRSSVVSADTAPVSIGTVMRVARSGSTSNQASVLELLERYRKECLETGNRRELRRVNQYIYQLQRHHQAKLETKRKQSSAPAERVDLREPAPADPRLFSQPAAPAAADAAEMVNANEQAMQDAPAITATAVIAEPAAEAQPLTPYSLYKQLMEDLPKLGSKKVADDNANEIRIDERFKARIFIELLDSINFSDSTMEMCYVDESRAGQSLKMTLQRAGRIPSEEARLPFIKADLLSQFIGLDEAVITSFNYYQQTRKNLAGRGDAIISEAIALLLSHPNNKLIIAKYLIANCVNNRDTSPATIVKESTSIFSKLKSRLSGTPAAPAQEPLDIRYSRLLQSLNNATSMQDVKTLIEDMSPDMKPVHDSLLRALHDAGIAKPAASSPRP